MNVLLIFCVTFCVINITLSKTHASQIDFSEKAKSENFNSDELELLQPIIDNLQIQYKDIYSKAKENGNLNTDVNDNQLNDLLATVLQQLEAEDDLMSATFVYNISLPTIGDIKGSLNHLSSDEAHDIENIFQEIIDEGHEAIQSLVRKSDEATAPLITINKIRIVRYIYRRLGDIFALAVRASRAAYCTYSHIPIMNSTLNEGGANVESCYVYTRNSIGNLRNEVQTAINDIRSNILDLVNIYKRIASNNSLLGKLFSGLLYVSRVRNDIRSTQAIATKTIQDVKTEAPIIVATTRECATSSVPIFVTQLNETITSLMTCITFVDDSTVGPEPEPESSEEEDDSEEINRN